MAVAPIRAVTLSTSTLTVQENNSATYTVRLASRPTGGDVTVTITGAGSGITVSVTSLTFTGANWNTPQQVRVDAADDGNIRRESVTLTHTPSGAGTDYAGVAAGGAECDGGGRRRAGAAARAGRRPAAGGIRRRRHLHGAAAIRAVGIRGGDDIERRNRGCGGCRRRYAARPGYADVQRDELVDSADGDGSGGVRRRRRVRDGDAAAHRIRGGQRLRGRDGDLHSASLGRGRDAGADRRVGFGGGPDEPNGALDAVTRCGRACGAVASARPSVEHGAAADADGRRRFGAHRRAGHGRGVRSAGAGAEPWRSGRCVDTGAGDAEGRWGPSTARRWRSPRSRTGR